jgi:NAD(P)H-dependent flavin oxidoreductase YrpB (nitropropane dioxygenase family)
MSRSTLSPASKTPRIIQGGMGIAVSSWCLARAVAISGEIGVVSATAIDSVLVRELQNGDPNGRLRVLESYPDQEIVSHLRDRYFVEGGKSAEKPYRLLPMHRFNPTVQSQRILSAATFAEVALAKEGHEGYVGINLLCELKRYTLPCLYGAMLAGVDAVMMGAGIPLEEARLMPDLAAGNPVRLKIEVDTSQSEAPLDAFHYELDPSNLVPEVRPLATPDFYPIVSSDLLARILATKLPEGLIAGWIIEGPIAGGHNAPPRAKKYDENENPVYDHRDVADLAKVAALGYPYYLAGGYGTPAKLAEAIENGAAGVQIGSLFSLADESGYPSEYKQRMIADLHRGSISIRTDGRISPTGFPFKVLEVDGTNGIPEANRVRTRNCDLGYLQQAYVDSKGRLLARCPAEPVEDYVRKGGKAEDTERRGCLCNGLMANIGLGQTQKWGVEQPLFTGGDELLTLPLGSVDSPSYSAADVIAYLRSEIAVAA